jgi:hypothetical protein
MNDKRHLHDIESKIIDEEITMRVDEEICKRVEENLNSDEEVN